MKAVLSNRIYLSCDLDLMLKLQNELTYEIPSLKIGEPPIIIKNAIKVRKDLLSIPIGRTDLIPDNYEIIDKRVEVPAEFPEFKAALRPSQQEVHDELSGNAIINAKVGWGKTYLALKVAEKLGQKTLIITHTTNLRNQWRDTYVKVFGKEPGILGSGIENLNAPVVIGNIQTLYRRLDKIRKEFGTIILDEMHHVSSKTFSTIVDYSMAKYKIGLSGTIQRKDGKHVVFKDYFGNTLFQPPEENVMEPIIKVIKSKVVFQDGRMPWAIKVNNLVGNELYQHLVAQLAHIQAKRGHKVLLVSDRVQFLETIADMCGEKAITYTGKNSQEEREEILRNLRYGKYDILCATQAMFSEGMSENCLSCLILGTPVNNSPLLEQLIGRIKRIEEGKKTPEIIDIHLMGKTATRQATQRYGYYIKQGYKIDNVKLS